MLTITFPPTVPLPPCTPPLRPLERTQEENPHSQIITFQESPRPSLFAFHLLAVRPSAGPFLTGASYKSMSQDKERREQDKESKGGSSSAQWSSKCHAALPDLLRSLVRVIGYPNSPFTRATEFLPHHAQECGAPAHLPPLPSV